MRIHSGLLATCSFLLVITGNVATAMATQYFVAADGDDANDGLTQASPWATITYAATIAAAGDTVYVKAGHYPNEIVKIANSGTAQAPIVFQGYASSPGDTPDPQYTPGSPPNPALIPVLEAVSEEAKTYPVRGIGIWGKSYIEIRNFALTKYNEGIYPQDSDHILVENVYVTSLGAASGQGNGIWFLDSTDMTLRNCVVADASMQNITLQRVQNSVVENCRSYAVTADNPAVTDYHIVIVDGQYNTIRNCSAENLHSQVQSHDGHGIGIKDFAGENDVYAYPHSEQNQIINCRTHNTYESFFVAHEAHHNLFQGCTALADHDLQSRDWGGIMIRDGAHDNVFSDLYVEGFRDGAMLHETTEGRDDQVVTGNLITNTVFVDNMKTLEFWFADNNTFANCVFDHTGSWALVRFPFERTGQGNSCRNSIVTNNAGDLFYVDKGSTEQFVFTYTDFFQNTFDPPTGEGIISVDPLFVDGDNKDFHLRSKQGRWAPASSSWVNDTVTSPCIDTGNPSDDYSAEPCPNGARVDMGIYGNTTQASKSGSTQPCVNAGGSAGTGHTGPAGSGGAFTAAGGSPPSADGGLAADSEDSEDGCSCSTRQRGSGTAWLLMGAWAIAALIVRAKRRSA